MSVSVCTNMYVHVCIRVCLHQGTKIKILPSQQTVSLSPTLHYCCIFFFVLSELKMLQKRGAALVLITAEILLIRNKGRSVRDLTQNQRQHYFPMDIKRLAKEAKMMRQMSCEVCFRPQW